MIRSSHVGIAAIVSIASVAVFARDSFAQASSHPEASASDQPSVDEIVVTARKREETALSVPVVITAVSGADPVLS